MMSRARWLQTFYQHGIYQYDLRMLLWFMHTRHRQIWIAAARAFSRSGDGLMQVLLPGTLWLLDSAHGGKLFFVTAIAFAIERPLYWILKNSCQRRRPPEAIPSFRSVITASDRFSFPSGHTCGAFVLAGMVSEHYATLALPLYLWSSAVGISRVVLGVHFPTDILAGALIGSGIAWFVTSYCVALPF
ncbi:MAG TPA: phosphatase PAP2 family protein [Spongiibacteraceae bacterium]|jgi:undecaprenyl-diphosphatase